MSSEAPALPDGRAAQAVDPLRMPFLAHLSELRRRIIWSLAAVVVGAVICWTYAAQIMAWMLAPLRGIEGLQMVSLGPLEMFVTYIRLAAVGGLMIASPAVLWQLWGFVAPGLYPHERRLVLPFVGLGTTFFVGGAAFCFFLVLPASLKFLSGLAPSDIASTYSVALYMSLILHLMLAFGIVFELPLIMTMLSAAHLVSARRYRSWRRVWVVVAFVIGGVLTPTPDPYTQAMMALPLIGFFELGIVGARWMERRAGPRGRREVGL